jgi:hypothetical protein
VVSGSCKIEVFPQGSETPAISETVTLLPDQQYVAIAYGDGANQPLGLKFLEDDDSAPSSGNVKFRMGHLAPFADTIAETLVDLRFQNDDIIVDDLTYDVIGDYTELQAAKFDFKYTTPDGLTTLIDPLEVTIGAGNIRSLFAVGDGVNQPLGVFLLPPGSPGYLIPLVGHDVSLTPAAVEGYGMPGEMVVHTLTIKNEGNVTDIFNLAISNPAEGWEATLPVTSVMLKGGASEQVNVWVTIPADAQFGDSDTITLTATSDLVPSVTTSATITTKYGGVSLLPAYQEGFGLPGHVVEYDLTLTNIRYMTDTFDLTLSVIGEGWAAELSDTSLTLAAGENQQVVLWVTVPDSAQIGNSYAISVTATSQTEASLTSTVSTMTFATYGDIYMPVIQR